ncbi:MAG: DUF4380 domain-containing protein [Bacteroidales bacterium]|nr:DUF4380 domain-containing protein [Bacteroidales bacterium]
MNKFITAVASIALLGCVAASAAEPQTKSLGENKYSLSVGPVSITIDAGAGAKVLSFTNDGKEVISQLQRFNAFGSTFWTSPQKEWNWPPVAEYDRNPYEVEDNGTSFVMTSQKSEKFGYRIRKEFAADPKDNAIVITYSIINESGKSQKVAPWEITRVPGDGLIFFAAEPSKIVAASGELLKFEGKYGAAWYTFDETKENRKINADGKGWLAYSNNGLLLVKKFPDLVPSQPAPDEAEIQVYVNEGKTFIELESQGTYTTLQPGESLNYTVRWYLVPQPKADVPSSKLVKTVKKLIK